MIMRRRHRFRRIAKWVGTVLCTLVFAAWVVSVPTFRKKLVRWGFVGRNVHIELFRGYIRLDQSSQPLPDLKNEPGFNGWFRGQDTGHSLETYGLVLPQSYDFPRGAGAGVILPLWLPLLVFTIPTLMLWYRDRRRIPPGHCPSCNYNLTG